MSCDWMFEFNEKPVNRKMSGREECLRKANECVNGASLFDYGVPEDNFKKIANLWSIYLNFEISEEDVAMMMTLLKVARVATGTGKADNFIDICGYSACAYEIYQDRKER